ncbi:VOC family protein [Archangium primigenium]|uniref:VOC family protein n=1 Tax=Melittangium TaxID=44 RepID=UPI001959850E|nr:VOC family protein [Archangium primigenium]MBM7119253.1 VOC family protein [Archangium primigenium]
MKIKLTSVLVDDQAKALAFYTEKLGFLKKNDIPMGPYRWLTVVSPSEPDGAEVVLEPMAHAFSKTYQRELYSAGIPLTAFFVEDLASEFTRLKALGVVFANEPMSIPGGPTVAKIDDTCGNFLQLVQV